MTTWWVALRFARRSVRRSLSRSILVIALIALPVAGFTVADGLVRTMTDRDVDVDRAMGVADLRVDVVEREAFDVMSHLPKGSRIAPISNGSIDGSLRLAAGDRLVRTKLDVVALGNPLTAHLARLSSGRLPRDSNEVLVTRPLATRLGLLDGDHLRPGAKLTTTGGLLVPVTGIADNPYHLDREAVVASPGSLLERARLDRPSPHPVGYLVDLPAGVDAAAFARAWSRAEATVTTRESFVDETPVGGYLLDAATEPISLFAGLGLLGIVFTASAAFAVGTRRQVRELGLVAANGGTAKHVRRIVLAQGLVLGALGAASGLVLGAAVTVLGTPLWQRLTGQLVEDLRFGWGELVIVAAVGVLASVAAAVVPAVGAGRMPPVDALAGRFPTAPPRARLPLAGVLLMLLGVTTAIAAGMLGRVQVVEYRDLMSRNNTAPPLDLTLPIDGILLGTVLTVTGLVLVIPALVAGVSRFGGRLPLAGRLAVRNAVRHRRRTAAATAAVMVTVAGSVATAFVLAARADNAPKTLPEGVVVAELDGIGRYNDEANGEQSLEQAKNRILSAAPGVTVWDVTVVGAYPDAAGSAPIFVSPQNSTECEQPETQLGVGDPSLIELSTGRQPDAGLRAALAEGKIVVFDDCLVSHKGTVLVEHNVHRPVEVHAYLAERGPGTEHYRYLPGAFISAPAAAARGWSPYSVSIVARLSDTATVQTLVGAAEDAGLDTHLEETLADQVTNLYLVLVGVAALVALLSAGVTVALSAADGRSDLATLAALGAQPRRRRTLAGAQALVVTGLGTIAGLGLGAVVGFAATSLAGVSVVTVPWRHLWLLAGCVPLLAAVVAVVATPSRLPMIARRQS